MTQRLGTELLSLSSEDALEKPGLRVTSVQGLDIRITAELGEARTAGPHGGADLPGSLI